MSDSRQLIEAALAVAGSQADLARVIGVTPQAVKYWAAGANEPRHDSMLKMRELVAAHRGEQMTDIQLIASEYPLLPLEADESQWVSRLLAILVDRRWSRTLRIAEVARQIGGRA